MESHGPAQVEHVRPNVSADSGPVLGLGKLFSSIWLAKDPLSTTRNRKLPSRGAFYECRQAVLVVALPSHAHALPFFDLAHRDGVVLPVALGVHRVLVFAGLSTDSLVAVFPRVLRVRHSEDVAAVVLSSFRFFLDLVVAFFLVGARRFYVV